MSYLYSTIRGNAVLNKGDDHKLVKIGKFKSEEEARQACLKHYEKAQKSAQNLGISLPKAFFI